MAARDLRVGDRTYQIWDLPGLGVGDVASLPYSLKVLLENLVRNNDGVSVTDADVEQLASWDPSAEASNEIQFSPARILMQDFTGVPCVVDLAAMRDAIVDLGGDPSTVNPLIPAEMVIDHSISVDSYGAPDSLVRNGDIEFQRNGERYEFLKWGQTAFKNLLVVPPNTGICHQVNMEYLSRVVFTTDDGMAYPDTLVGTDSHTTMVNGLGVLGWGVGGIEAEAAMLGQPVSMLTPRVVGFKLTGELPEGATATDLVLTVTQLLRKHGVVGKFVEFYGDGVTAVPVENRATIGNMSPEYGSTCAIFPIDAETLRYLTFTGRSDEQVRLVEAYAKEQGLWHEPSNEPRFSEHLELDLGTVVPSLAGPARPQDRVPLDASKSMFREALGAYEETRRGKAVAIKTKQDERSMESFPASDPPSSNEGDATDGEPNGGGVPDADPTQPHNGASVTTDMGSFEVNDGHVVIAAITSCTNTSNPYVMVGAGLLAKKAVEAGLETKPWVKTSLAPGSKVVTDYYEESGLTPYLDQLRFNTVGYGCTTCIGNSGPLAREISMAVGEHDLAVAAVLSGNRNFEGRINPDVRMNYLASPPLVVAYALAGTMDWDPYSEPIPGSSVMLKDIWPTTEEVNAAVADGLKSEMYKARYANVVEGDERWRALPIPEGDRYAWGESSTYIRRPTYFDGMPVEPEAPGDIVGARVLAKLGDSITTDHISPAGSIRGDGPAGSWLREQGVGPEDFNSYGSRRGNHEVMIRGTFANIRLRNQLAPGTEGGVTRHLPDGQAMSIYDAAQRYAADGVPLVVLAGKEYGSGSSRDWAAKGTTLLGVRAVIAESYERIHRSNLIGMGVLPLQLAAGQTADSLGLTGEEEFTIRGIEGRPVSELLGATLTVEADGTSFEALCRIDTPTEAEYYRHGGILRYVARQLAGLL